MRARKYVIFMEIQFLSCEYSFCEYVVIEEKIRQRYKMDFDMIN